MIHAGPHPEALALRRLLLLQVEHLPSTCVVLVVVVERTRCPQEALDAALERAGDEVLALAVHAVEVGRPALDDEIAVLQ
jgi:hypothetical protein